MEALRAAGALTISLMAQVDGKAAGHIAFSPVIISDGTTGWYGVGPVSVLPKLQRQGVGKPLVGEGLSRLKAFGAGGCVLVGDPAYYAVRLQKSPPSGSRGRPSRKPPCLALR